VVLGLLNRRLLIGRLTEGGTLFRVVGIEIGVAALVLALTAALVNKPPARDTFVEPFSAVVSLVDQPATGSVQVEVFPARAGANDIHLYFLDDDGLPRAVDAAEIALGRTGVPDRRIEVTQVRADHALSYGAVFPTAGTWTVTVTTARDGEVSTTALEVPIR
jgi:copper transport protein